MSCADSEQFGGCCAWFGVVVFLLAVFDLARAYDLASAEGHTQIHRRSHEQSYSSLSNVDLHCKPAQDEATTLPIFV